MASSTSTGSSKSPGHSLAGVFAIWNRKLHYYTGLFLLLFLWLFSLTGLILNHPRWTFAEFWPTRVQSAFERQIQPPPPGSDLVQARDIMNQLGLRGEIDWTSRRDDFTRLDFRVSRPGHNYEVKLNLTTNLAAVQQIDLNAWGVARLLHTFTGVRTQDSRNDRDWIMTVVWVYSMDAVALGTMLMVLGSIYMWWIQPQKRRLGSIAVALGVVSCGFFVFALRWIV